MHDLSNHPVEDALKKIKKVYAVMSGKGGVGKSTVTANLAKELARRGNKVGIVDADLHGPSMMRLFGVVGERVGVTPDNYIIPVEKDGVKIMSVAATMDDEETSAIWRGPMKIGVITQFISDVDWGDELDYLIIDLPPGTGDEPLTVAQTIPDAEAIIVTTPQEVSVIDVRKSITFCNKLNIKIRGIIENMGAIICHECSTTITLFPGQGGQKLSDEYKLPFLGSIPFEPNVAAQADNGEAYLLDGAGLSTEVFLSIVDKIVEEN